MDVRSSYLTVRLGYMKVPLAKIDRRKFVWALLMVN